MNQGAGKKIMLSFDIEFWYDEGWISEYIQEGPKEDFIEESLALVLVALEKYNAKATFFVTGKVAEKYPQLVGEIARQGHEVASHGYSHKPLHELGAQQFEREIQKAVSRIEETTGKKPKGFRAPSFSLNNATKWALPILAKSGFTYDSSIFPVSTTRYGVSGAPQDIYKISFEDVKHMDSQSPLLEVPLSTSSFGFTQIPIAGGIYFRLVPYWLFSYMLRARQRKGGTILYFHLYELYKDTPIIKEAPLPKRFLKYYGIESNFNRFERLLSEFEFDSIDHILCI